MNLYIAPPRGKKEKESYLAWVTGLGFTPIWLDLRRKVKGPLLLCGGADIGKDLEDLTNDPEKISKLIFKFCDLEWSKNVLNFYERNDLISSTASNIQIRNKIYKYDNSKFKKYEEYISSYITKNSPLKI